MAHPTQLRADESVLIVVDVQEKLVPRIHQAEAMIGNIAFLLDVAALLEIPVRATEQYPRGLGPTVAPLASRLPEPRHDKVAFSCCGIAGFAAELKALGRPRVVLTGIEAHVCMPNTALDLLAEGFRVYLPVDATGSRAALDKETAVRRLELAGAVPTTSETVAFEWLGGAQHPQFKKVSSLIQSRFRGPQ